MRAFILTIILCLAISSQTHAQRYFPGLVGIQAKAGVVDGFHIKKGDKQAYSFGLSMNMYTHKAHQWVFGVEYLEKKNAYKESLIPIQQYMLFRVEHFIYSLEFQGWEDMNKSIKGRNCSIMVQALKTKIDFLEVEH